MVDLSDFENPENEFDLKKDSLPLNGIITKYSDQFTENYALVIEQFQEKWLPAQLFRSAGTANFEGPSTWARMQAKIKSSKKKANQ